MRTDPCDEELQIVLPFANAFVSADGNDPHQSAAVMHAGHGFDIACDS